MSEKLQETDVAAQAPQSSPAQPLVQDVPVAPVPLSSEAALVRADDGDGDDPLGGSAISSELAGTLKRRSGSGKPLDSGLAQSFGEHYGTDLSGVRVHTGGEADKISRSVQATAFSHGEDVYFSEGTYNPGSDGGKRLLAHELAHVAQHRKGEFASGGGTIGRADDPAEAAADAAADGAMAAIQRSPIRRAQAPEAERASSDTVDSAAQSAPADSGIHRTLDPVLRRLKKWAFVDGKYQKVDVDENAPAPQRNFTVGGGKARKWVRNNEGRMVPEGGAPQQAPEQAPQVPQQAPSQPPTSSLQGSYGGNYGNYSEPMLLPEGGGGQVDDGVDDPTPIDEAVDGGAGGGGAGNYSKPGYATFNPGADLDDDDDFDDDDDDDWDDDFSDDEDEDEAPQQEQPSDKYVGGNSKGVGNGKKRHAWVTSSVSQSYRDEAGSKEAAKRIFVAVGMHVAIIKAIIKAYTALTGSAPKPVSSDAAPPITPRPKRPGAPQGGGAELDDDDDWDDDLSDDDDDDWDNDDDDVDVPEGNDNFIVYGAYGGKGDDNDGGNGGGPAAYKTTYVDNDGNPVENVQDAADEDDPPPQAIQSDGYSDPSRLDRQVAPVRRYNGVYYGSAQDGGQEAPQQAPDQPQGEGERPAYNYILSEGGPQAEQPAQQQAPGGEQPAYNYVQAQEEAPVAWDKKVEAAIKILEQEGGKAVVFDWGRAKLAPEQMPNFLDRQYWRYVVGLRRQRFPVKDNGDMDAPGGKLENLDLSEYTVEWDTTKDQQEKTLVEVEGGLLKRGPKADKPGPVDTDDSVTFFSGPGYEIFAVSTDGEIHMTSHKISQVHHSSLLGAKNVAVAGEMKVANGKIITVSNKTGHYLASKDQLIQFLHWLEKDGVPLDFELGLGFGYKAGEVTPRQLVDGMDTNTGTADPMLGYDQRKLAVVWESFQKSEGNAAMQRFLAEKKWTGGPICTYLDGDEQGKAVPPKTIREALKEYFGRKSLAKRKDQDAPTSVATFDWE